MSDSRTAAVRTAMWWCTSARRIENGEWRMGGDAATRQSINYLRKITCPSCRKSKLYRTERRVCVLGGGDQTLFFLYATTTTHRHIGKWEMCSQTYEFSCVRRWVDITMFGGGRGPWGSLNFLWANVAICRSRSAKCSIHSGPSISDRPPVPGPQHRAVGRCIF